MTTAMALMVRRSVGAPPSGAPLSLRPMRLPRHTHLLVALALAAVVVLALAPAALAVDGGQGTIGEADDKVVTNAGFIVIAFFPLFILAMSLLQWRLDKRKDARKAALKRRKASADWRGGW